MSRVDAADLPAARSVTASAVADARAVLGESPLWDEVAGLRWLDITGHRLFTLNPSGHIHSVGLSHRVTAIGLGPDDHRLFAVTTRGFGWLDPRDGDVLEHVSLDLRPDATMNDGAIDPHGRCWAGSATYDGARRSHLFRLAGTTVHAVVDGIGMSNGIDWSPSGSTMYHVDSTSGTVAAWRYDQSTGQVGEHRVLRTVPPSVGKPDGLTVDADGYLWLAVWGAGQVWRIDPADGRIVLLVSVPTPLTTSCVLGGRTLDTLYITTAAGEGDPSSGLLYASNVPARGRRPNRFSGDLP